MKNNLNRKARRAQKFRGYSPVRAEGGEGEHTKVSIEKGFGPRHAANAQEGQDLTKVNTDTVAAMLTPREAVLNRNAAELAGRPQIEALNKEGNKLAERGVDLAAKGDGDVAGQSNLPLRPGGFSNELIQWIKENPDDPEARMLERVMRGGDPELMAARGTSDMKNTNSKQKPSQKPAAAQRGGFYPPGMSKFAEGDAEVPGGIGRPNPQTAYDPRAQVDFKAPDLSGFIRALHEEGKKQGISEGQMAQIAKQFSGLGGGGAPAGGDMPYDQLGGQYASFTGGTPGYQGGISEIGYPPMLMPDAEYHADKGSTWTGRYDPQFLVERYAGGTGDVPGYRRGNPDFSYGNFEGAGYVPPWAEPTPIPGNTGPEGFGRPSTMAEGGGNSGYVNRSSWGGGQPGMPWSPTAIPTSYNPQGYPYAVPVQGPDQNLQGVGRTHNLRKNQ